METVLLESAENSQNVKKEVEQDKVLQPKLSFSQRQTSIIKELQEKKKKKLNEENQKKLRLEKIIERNKKSLGLSEIKPKLFEEEIICNSTAHNSTKSNDIHVAVKDVNEVICKISQSPNKKSKKNKKNKKKKLKPIVKRSYTQTQIDVKPILLSNKEIALVEKEKAVIQERALKLKNCYTLEDWKRRNKINNDIKVFVCFPGYPDFRKALLDRGWTENKDPNSLFFDLKCGLSGRHIEFDKINQKQIVNHFEKNSELTRKVCLSKNLRNLKWFRNVNIETFYPRCYDLSDINDVEDFSEDFKITKAESILKAYIKEERLISEEKIKTAIKILERQFKDIDEIIDLKVVNKNIYI
jgi:hypothetical protein